MMHALRWVKTDRANRGARRARLPNRAVASLLASARRSVVPNVLRILCALLAGSLLGGLPAQVFTVGGSNPDYVSLPQAVAAVAPGSILIVRPGKHKGFATNKALRIHLDFTALGGSIEPPLGSAYAITLSGMPADGSFALVGDGARVDAGTLGAIRIANTAGRVVVSGLTVMAGAATSAIDVQNAGPVVLHDCGLSGTPALLVQTATVVATDLRVGSPAGHGVAAYQAMLDFAGGSFGGGDAAALHLTNCSARFAGDGATLIKVGGSSPVPASAFEAVDSVVVWDPSRFFLSPANGAPGFATGGATTVLTEDPPIVSAQGGPLGGNASIGITSNTPLPGMVVVAPFVPPFFLGLAGLYVDLGQPFATPLVGIVDPAGLSVSFQIPTTTSLLGDVSCVQGAVFSASGLPTLSGPAPLITL